MKFEGDPQTNLDTLPVSNPFREERKFISLTMVQTTSELLINVFLPEGATT